MSEDRGRVLLLRNGRVVYVDAGPTWIPLSVVRRSRGIGANGYAQRLVCQDGLGKVYAAELVPADEKRKTWRSWGGVWMGPAAALASIMTNYLRWTGEETGT